MFRVGQHFRDFDFARFNEPAVENFQKQITLKIDKDWLGIFIATFRAAPTQCLLGRANIDKARQIFLSAQFLNSVDQLS